MRRSVRNFIEAGRRFYAECGGLMYLSKSIEGSRMVGLIDADIEMTSYPVDFGYCEVTTQRSSILGPAGTVVRGHQFHHSRTVHTPPANLYVVRRQDTFGVEGYHFENGVASYVHLHFLSNPEVAWNLLHSNVPPDGGRRLHVK
jgi:cobyrinic acid a,c-diamide synthase